MKYALVVVRIPLDKPFTYGIPANMEKDLSVGKRVWVPFGYRRLIGYVVGITDKVDIKNVKNLESIIDSEPIVSSELIDLAQWIFEEFRITIAKQTLSRELRAMGYRKLSARPRHHAQAEGAIEDFKKTSPRAWRQLRARRRLTATR